MIYDYLSPQMKKYVYGGKKHGKKDKKYWFDREGTAQVNKRGKHHD